MPCSNCDHLLCLDKGGSLFCPDCQDFPIEDSDIADDKIATLRDEILTEENIVGLIGDYSKSNLILYLVWRLNVISNEFYKENRMRFREFVYLNTLIRGVYSQDSFGDSHLQDATDLDEEIDILLDTYSELIEMLDNVEEDFNICVKNSDSSSPPQDFQGNEAIQSFYGEYRFPRTEYSLCFERCVESIIGGSEEDRADYNAVVEHFRDFDKPDIDEADTLREYSDALYEFIVQMKFTAASSPAVSETYYTRFPDEVTVFDLQNFLENLNDQFEDEAHAGMWQEAYLATTRERVINNCGRDVFRRNWRQVKNRIMVDEDSLDAHPFLFKIWDTEEKKLPRGTTFEVPVERILYPKFYARLLTYQVIPLLQNGDKPSGHEILRELTAERGKVYERNIHEYLVDKGIESYHSTEITRSNRNEIDVLFVRDGSLYFVEAKYIMPRINMNSSAGIEEANEIFDYRIFGEESEFYEGESTGKPFPEKVSAWKNLESGATFTSQVGRSEEEREGHEFKEEWADLEMEMLVVSNIVPSYVEKQGVRFLTDLEFYRMLERDEDVFYAVP